jgi:mRNA interferase HigB
MWNLLQAVMQVIALRTLKQFWAAQDQAETPLRAWYVAAAQAAWNKPQDIKTEYGATVDFVGDNRAIFDIAGNKYRLVMHVSYTYKRVLVKFIGTHKEYDKINAETV